MAAVEWRRWRLRSWELISCNRGGDILKLKAPVKTSVSNVKPDFGNISEEINGAASHAEINPLI